MSFYCYRGVGKERIDSTLLVTWHLFFNYIAGRCYTNPYASATMYYISKSYTSPTVYKKSYSYYMRGYGYFYCSSSYNYNYKWEIARLGSVSEDTILS